MPLSWLHTDMEYIKFGSQLPEALYERFAELEHGDKRIACAAALLWYFTTEPEVARLYREWARAITEGFATIEEPPETVKTALKKRAPQPPPRRKKRSR